MRRKYHPFSDLDCGYLEKHSNAKRWIEDSQDLEDMYKAFSHAGDEITVWCENRRKSGKKRKIDSVEEGDGKKAEDTVKSKRAAKEEKIDAITQELREKHGEQFTGPQLRLWARMHLKGNMTA